VLGRVFCSYSQKAFEILGVGLLLSS